MRATYAEKTAVQKVRDVAADVMCERGHEMPGLCLAVDHGIRPGTIEMRLWQVRHGHRYSMTYLMSASTIGSLYDPALPSLIDSLFDQFKAGPQ